MYQYYRITSLYVCGKQPFEKTRLISEFADIYRLHFARKEEKNNVCRVIILRIIVDYVVGITDRMAEKEYNQIISSLTNWARSTAKLQHLICNKNIIHQK